jgi:hypothetical protein
VPSFCYDARVNFSGEAMIMRHPRTRMTPGHIQPKKKRP